MNQNKIENQTPANIELTHPLSINSSHLLNKDVWCPETDLGLEINKHQCHRILNFSRIEQIWLKQKVKQYIIYKTIQGTKFNTVQIYLNILVQISILLKQQTINGFQEIDEEVIEQLLATIKKYAKSYQQQIISHFKGFLNFGNIEGWFEIPTYILEVKSYRVSPNNLIKYIPDEVLQQLDEHLHLMPSPIQRLIILIRALGLRACEILLLKFDCLRQRKDGEWEIEFTNWKLKNQLDRLPINEELVGLIKHQQEYINQNLSPSFTYLFCGNAHVGQKKEVGKIIFFQPCPKILALDSFNYYLNKLSTHCDIKDKAGKQWHFTSHQFRRTVATVMTNEQVRQYIIQCYLRHQSPDMIQHYAQLLPDTLKQEMEQFRQHKKIVDITGREIEQVHDELDNNIGLSWLRAKMQPKALAMGFCARPELLKPCPHANTCMTCQHFRLDEDDLPALNEHLLRNNKLKAESQKLGYTRQVQFIEQDEKQLINLINSLAGNNG